jgi:tol-pal system protein YbgF
MMKKILIIIFTFLVSTLFLADCASRKEIRQFQDDVSYLKIRVDTLHQENLQLKRMLRDLDQSLTNMESEFVRTRADLLSEMTNIREQSQYIDNKLEDNISQMSRYVVPAERYAPLQGQLSTKTVSGKNPGTDSLRQKSEGPVMDAQQLYNTAYLDVTKGNYELARQGFQEFLRVFPTSTLADNAQYWIAESYYGEGKYQEAIKGFEQVIDNYPAGDKVSAAMLKLGFSYQKLGDTATANVYLQQVIEKYAGSEEARIARERLQEVQ